MTTSPIPTHLHAVTTSLVCTPCAEAIDFYRRAFGAEEVGERMTGPDGAIAHAEIRIGDSVIMLGDEWPGGPVQSPTSLGGSTAALFIYTDDVETLWQRAIAAGAKEVFPLALQFYGDRSGRLRDRTATHGDSASTWRTSSDAEVRRRMAAFYEDSSG